MHDDHSSGDMSNNYQLLNKLHNNNTITVKIKYGKHTIYYKAS